MPSYLLVCFKIHGKEIKKLNYYMTFPYETNNNQKTVYKQRLQIIEQYINA